MGSRRKRFAGWFVTIGVAPEDDEDLRLRKALLVSSSGMLCLAALLWGLMYLVVGRPFSALIPLGYSLLTAVSIWFFARHCRFRLFRTSQLSLQLFLPFLLGLSLGGMIAASFLLTPVVNDQEFLSETTIVLFGVMNIAGLSTIIFVLMQYFTIERDSAQANSEALLLNILPASIANALKAGPGTIAEHYEGVSVLFADIVNFTEMSAQLTPTDLGDCYMAAAGVPQPREDHAQIMIELAIRVRDHMEITEWGGRRLEFRIGINSGPVVAGVIGIRKFIYDLWGDAVNTASRMESHGERGSIQITEATYELIKDEFECEAMGSIDIKGKGEMPVWHVLRSLQTAGQR